MKSNTKKFILVNSITALRFLGSLLLIPLYLKYGPIFLAIYIILFFSTDWIDGLLARTFKISTFFGAIFDSISDKLFDIIILLILISISKIMIIPLVLELSIFFVNTNSALKGNMTESTKIGKAKTFIVALCIILILFLKDYSKTQELFTILPNINANEIVLYQNVLSIIALFTELITLIEYIILDYQKTKANKRYQEKIKNVKSIKDYFNIRKELINGINNNFKSKEEIKEYLFSPEYYQKYKKTPLNTLGTNA